MDDLSVVGDEDESQALIVLPGPSKSYDSMGSKGEGTRKQDLGARLKIPHGEHTQAYEILRTQGLLITAFRKDRFSDIFEKGDLEPNSTRSINFVKQWKWGVYWTPGCGLVLYNVFHKEVSVPPGHVCCFITEDNEYVFAKPGLHNIADPFMKRVGGPIPIGGTGDRGHFIEHGDRTIVMVPQGMLGYATDMGQPMLFPPGLHCWTSETIRFEKMHKLDENPVITIGPYTILTVHDGHVAVTINNGKRVLMEGGRTHLLTHQKWKFERFINVKLQSEDLKQVNVSTADNIMLTIDATVNWKISAALMDTENFRQPDDTDISLAGTMVIPDFDEDGVTNKLRREILKLSITALSRFAGSVNYCDYFNYISSLIKRNQEASESDHEHENENGHGHGHFVPSTRAEGGILSPNNSTPFMNPLFNTEDLAEAVAATNMIAKEFGIEVIGISVISARPMDENLMTSLSTSTLASAEALQAETHARGMAIAMRIEADSAAAKKKVEAEALAKEILIMAKADAEADILRSDGAKEAEILRAEGLKQAASLLEGSEVAVQLETINASAKALKNTDKFFFGQQPEYMQNLTMNQLNRGDAEWVTSIK